MSVPQPVSRIFQWLPPMGILERGILHIAGLREEREFNLESAAPSTDLAGGLQPGSAAPDFTLPRIGGRECTLSDFRGRRVLLVFIQPGCPRARYIGARLSRIHRSRTLQVIVVCRGTRHDAALWADATLAPFPVLISSDPAVPMAYDAADSPCEVEIDEQGQIVACGTERSVKPRRVRARLLPARW